MNWYPVGPVEEIATSGRKLFTVGELRLAVFLVDGTWSAIDNHCPHRGGPIAAGDWQGNCIVCPWHSAQYDLVTGQPLSMETSPLRKLAVRVEQGILEVDLDSISNAPVSGGTLESDDGIHRCVVRYGRGSDVGVFGTVHEIECSRGDQVVVQSHRGTELGVILQVAGDDAPAASGVGLTSATIRGELLRIAVAQDATLDEAAMKAAAQILAKAESECGNREIPVQLVDGYQTLDGGTAIVYFLGADTAELGPIAVSLGEHFGKSVRFQKLKLE